MSDTTRHTLVYIAAAILFTLSALFFGGVLHLSSVRDGDAVSRYYLPVAFGLLGIALPLLLHKQWQVGGVLLFAAVIYFAVSLTRFYEVFIHLFGR